MSGEKRIPMVQFIENEELAIGNEDKDSRRKLSQTSCSSDACFVNPLMSAIRRGKSFKKSFFKESKLEDSDMKETDDLRRNVFHYAVSRPDTLRKLLENAETETSVQEALNQADEEGETPIHRAAVIANIESLKILHEYDNSLMKLKTTIRNRSVLHLAVKSRSVVLVKFVLSKDLDLVNTVDSMSQSPLHYAAGLKQSSALELLISKGGDATITDENGQLPLHIAASKGLKNNVSLLLRENPDFVDVLDKSSRSPLLLASQNNFPTVVSYLLSKNADYEIQDKLGLTAFDWAVSSNFPAVVQVCLDTNVWKEVVSGSHYGPEGCLKVMIETMPQMAKKLLDKCVTTEGSKDARDYKVIYDFFCLEGADKDGCPYPQFEALVAMMENESEICLGHPVSVKYVNEKWRKRGFKYNLFSIILNLIFHICLMIYTIKLIGQFKIVCSPGSQDHGKNCRNSMERKNETAKENEIAKENETAKTPKRIHRELDAPVMIMLRIILLTITFASMSKDIFQIKMQGFRYFTKLAHYLEVSMRITVVVFLLSEKESVYIGAGSFAVLYSWITLIQYLKLVPIMGIYIIVVQTIFWTLMKILLVVCIYLLSFSSTFYVLLSEHRSFRNMYISVVSTFVTMTSGMSNYQKHFVQCTWIEEVYEIKLVILVLFILVMMIVVNNALIGLAVGDTDEVMKSAKFDRFKRRAEFVIHLEKSANNISCLMRVKEDKFHIDFPQRKKSLHKKCLDLLYFGRQMYKGDGGSEKNEFEQEVEITLEENITKAVEIKLENLRSCLQHDLKGIQDQNEVNLNGLERKMDMILEKLK